MVKPYGQQVYDSCVVAAQATFIGASAGLIIGVTKERYKLWETCSAFNNNTFSDTPMIQFEDFQRLKNIKIEILASFILGGSVGVIYGLSTIIFTILFPAK